MGMRKRQKATHIPPKEPYDRLALLEYVQAMNLKAWRVMLVWLLFNSIIAVIYLLGIIGQAELILLSIFYFFCDITCILMFCPFQTFIMKNRCCVNCRIFDWGHFMMYTPLLFIPSFFTWSLFLPLASCCFTGRWAMPGIRSDIGKVAIRRFGAPIVKTKCVGSRNRCGPYTIKTNPA